MSKRLDEIRASVSALASEVKLAESDNLKIKQIEDELEVLNAKASLMSRYIRSTHNILLATKDAYSEYQKSRIAFIEISLKDNIDALFPKRNFTPIIDYTMYRNQIRSLLILKDPKGNTRYPDITEGGFLQQLIGYTSAMSILKLLGSKVFYIDEAFSNASEKSKEEMQSIIYGYTELDGLQTIMISQSSKTYEGLPRREFHLEFDNEADEAKLVKVKDYNPVFNLGRPRRFEEITDGTDEDSLSSLMEEILLEE